MLRWGFYFERTMNGSSLQFIVNSLPALYSDCFMFEGWNGVWSDERAGLAIGLWMSKTWNLEVSLSMLEVLHRWEHSDRMALSLEREIEQNSSLSPFRNLLRPATFPLLFQSPWRRVFEVRFFSPDTYLDEAWSWTFLNENVQQTTWGNMSMKSTDLTFSRQTLAGRDGVVLESLTIRGIIHLIHLGDFRFDECSMSVIERSCGIKIVYCGWRISYILSSPISNDSMYLYLYIFIFVILFHMIAFYPNSGSFLLEDSKIRFSTSSVVFALLFCCEGDARCCEAKSLALGGFLFSSDFQMQSPQKKR